MKTTKISWHGLYDSSWDGLIVPAAFQHPAKMARGLVVKIFDYLFERGYLNRGDVVVDPFGGVFTTGIEGATRGCKVFGCELEPKFFALALENIELHRRMWEVAGDPIPVIVQGDSRKLCEVLRPAMEAACVVGSPPFSDPGSQPPNIRGSRPVRSSWHKSPDRPDSYGDSPGQLGTMKSGDVAAVISSPPYSSGTVHGGNGIDASKLTGNPPGPNSQVFAHGYSDVVVSSPPYAETAVATERNFLGSGGGKQAEAARAHETAGYGDSPAQLGNLPAGDVAAAIVGSPPFMEAQSGGGISLTGTTHKDGRLNGGWQTGGGYDKPASGATEGNLADSQPETFWTAARDIVAQSFAILRPGGVAVWICKDFIRAKKRVPFSDQWQQLCEACGYVLIERIQASLVKEESGADLFGGEWETRTKKCSFFRRLYEKKFPHNAIDHEDVIIMQKPIEVNGGGCDVVVSSPPFQDREPVQDKTFRFNDGRKALPQGQEGYGDTPGQLARMKRQG